MPMKTMSFVRMISNDLLSEYRESAKTAEGSSRKCNIQGERKLMIKYFSQINKFIHLHNLCWFTCIKDKRKKKHWKVARILTIGKSPFHSSTCDVRAVNGDLCKLADYLQSSSRDTALIRTLSALHWEGFLKELKMIKMLIVEVKGFLFQIVPSYRSAPPPCDIFVRAQFEYDPLDDDLIPCAQVGIILQLRCIWGFIHIMGVGPDFWPPPHKLMLMPRTKQYNDIMEMLI